MVPDSTPLDESISLPWTRPRQCEQQWGETRKKREKKKMIAVDIPFGRACGYDYPLPHVYHLTTVEKIFITIF